MGRARRATNLSLTSGWTPRASLLLRRGCSRRALLLIGRSGRPAHSSIRGHFASQSPLASHFGMCGASSCVDGASPCARASSGGAMPAAATRHAGRRQRPRPRWHRWQSGPPGEARARPKRLRCVPGPAYRHICACNSVTHGLGKDIRPSKGGLTRQHGHIDPPIRNDSVPQRLTTQPSNIPHPANHAITVTHRATSSASIPAGPQ